ncbi:MULTISPECIES: hypothetical protein [unclassified Lysinibacillus]|uniref:hypothetical protein n=1 Tax=unclassified Lysinibacillus TaxID=2636778 RepID=UPI00201B3D38|nr:MULTISPECIES: hypothetical protein [unclassified Lysinibacillus]
MDTKTIARSISNKIHDYRESTLKNDQDMKKYSMNSDHVKKQLTSVFDVFYNQIGETINEGLGYTREEEDGLYYYLLGPKLLEVQFQENNSSLPKAKVLIKTPGGSNEYEEIFQLIHDDKFIWKSESGTIIDVMYIAKMIESNLE